MNLCPKCISLCTLCVLHHLVSATTGGFAEGMKTQINHACIENESKYVFVKIPFLIGSSFRARHTHEQPTQDLWHLRISNLSFESSKVTARVQSNYFPTDIGCRLLPPPQSNLSDTTLNYRIETYYNNNDLVPDFIPKNSSNLNQVKEDLFGQFGSFKNVSLSRFENNLSQTCPKSNRHLSDHHLSRFRSLYVHCYNMFHVHNIAQTVSSLP